MSHPAASVPGGTVFEAMIVPHRSLSPRGLLMLIGTIGCLSAVFAVRFWLLGAWPVAFFSVMEVAIAVALLRLNAIRARAHEFITLTDEVVRIRRTDRLGRQEEHVLPLGWLNVILEERPGRVPKLLLVTRGIQQEIAGSLGEAEKSDLAAALRGAIHGIRHPQFENSQLRD